MDTSLSTSHGNLRILYAEDNESDFFIFNYIVKKIFLNVDIVHFFNGLDLMDYMSETGNFRKRSKENKQHLVFLDINMPKLDGFELLKMIKSHENPEIKKLPIFMISTSSRPEDIQRSQDLGALGYIVKSAAYEDMKTTLYNLIHTSIQEGHVAWTMI